MPQEGEPYLIYLAAKAGKVDELEALLQDRLPRARVLQEYHKGQKDQPYFLTVTDYLEYVDKQTGFTPLLATVFWHRTSAARMLLEYGADVHNHGAKGDQTPLRLAVSDLNMDSRLIELLVSYGASPFLEAKDGMTPLDEVVQLRQKRIGHIPYALGSVLLCLRRRCAFRGHLELKVDRYMGLSQTWRKFFCVLAPREKVAGHATDMQLLVFSKNGFDPVTSILTTSAASIQVPLKAAHGRACFELALSNQQYKKPSKLFSPGSPRVGYSIFVRGLSKDAVEARWAHRFVELATCDPNKAMVNGDSEYQPLVRPSHASVATTAQPQSRKRTQQQNGSSDHHSKSASFSFSSDSAHVPNHRLPQSSAATDNQTEAHSQPTQAAASVPADSLRAHSVQAAPPPDTIQSQRSPSVSPGTPSPPSPSLADRTAPQPEPLSAAAPQRANSTELWHSNAAFDGGKRITGTSSYRASQSLPSAKSFTSIDRRLTDHWRAKAMQGLDERDSFDRDAADNRRALPVVSEHDSLPALLEEWGFTPQILSHDPPPPAQQQQQQQQQLVLNQQQRQQQQQQQLVGKQQQQDKLSPTSEAILDSVPKLSNNPILSHVAQPAIISSVRTSPATGLLGLPATRVVYQSSPSLKSPAHIHHHSPAAQHSLAAPDSLPAQDSPAAHPKESDFEELELAAEHQAVDDRPKQHAPSSLTSAHSGVPSLLIESNLEAVPARSTLLDIPSAELLDSILDFANAVCGDQQNNMSEVNNRCEAAPSGQDEFHSQAWSGGDVVKAHAPPTKRRPADFSMMSQTSAASSVEPFSDDDDVTILDTTEVKKLSPHILQVLPEGLQPEASGHSHTSRRPVLNPNHLDSRDEEDLVYEMGPGPSDAPFHHYSLSPQLMEGVSPSAAARYGHINRMYDTSLSDVSTHSNTLHHSHHSPRQHGYSTGIVAPPAYTQPDSRMHQQSSIYDSSGSQPQEYMGGTPSFPVTDQQLFFNVIEQPPAAPQMEPGDFREMIDGIMALSEQQAAQVHMSGGAAANAASLHPIWEDEEVCLEEHDSPCVATIGVCAT